MILAELIALVLGVGGLSYGATMFESWRRASREKNDQLERLNKRMQDELREALRSRDYRLLDDWLVIYADQATSETKKLVETRRAELYIEVNR